LPGRGASRTMGNAYVVSYVQLYFTRSREAEKYVKDPLEIHNIKQKDEYLIEALISPGHLKKSLRPNQENFNRHRPW
ncbi:hypothetical protein Tco_0518804, partial [Tanacetum coccineum]